MCIALLIYVLLFFHISFQRRYNKKSSRGSDRAHLDVVPSGASNSTATTDANTYENPVEFKATNGPDGTHKPPKEIYQNANVSVPVEQADLVYQNITRKQKGQGQSTFDFMNTFQLIPFFCVHAYCSFFFCFFFSLILEISTSDASILIQN